MSKIRVIYISRKYPPSIGGMQRLAERLVAELRPRQDMIAIARDCSRWEVAPFLGWALGRALWEILTRRDRSLVVHFGDPLVALLAPLCAAARVSTVVTVHGLDIIYPNRLYQVLIGIALRFVGTVVCISNAAKEACIRHGIPEEKCTVISPGVDAPRPIPRDVARQQLSSRFSIDLDDSFVILTVGRLVRRKGVVWFIESVLPTVVDYLPNSLYLIIGHGPDRDCAERSTKIADLSRNVMFLGEVDDLLLALCFAAADVFVMPNLSMEGDIEGFGLVALEASSAGLPVIAADTGGIRDAIRSGYNGILVCPGDTQSFASAILSLASNPAERNRIGQLGAEYTRGHFSWSAMAQAYMRLYHTRARGG